MTDHGTPPPPELSALDDPTRLLAAAWYADQLAEHERDGGHPGTSCRVISDLISGAIEHGVASLPVKGGVPLSTFFAEYRRLPGGEAEKAERRLEELHAAGPSPRRRRERRWIP